MNERIKVLVADDNREFAATLVKYLSKEDDLEVVEVARDGNEAYEKIVDTNPDIVLLDIIMPHLDGLGVLEKLNEFKKVVQKSALKKEPHLITNYVYELATVFHSYYSEEKIVTDNEKYTYERIMLIKAVKIIIANSLNLIGVAPAERM